MDEENVHQNEEATTIKKYMTPSEKVFLTELVSKFQHIIECKKTDAINAVEKKKTWAIITKEFNSVLQHSKRTPQQLQKAWENIKCRRKKVLSKEKQERMATGGGIFKVPPADDPVDAILDCVDIELKDSIIDSDENLLNQNYTLVGEILIPKNADNGNIMDLDISDTAGPSDKNTIRMDDAEFGSHEFEPRQKASSFETDKPAGRVYKKSQSRGSAIDRELTARLERIQQQQNQDREYHALRMENEKRLHSIQMEIEKAKLATAKIILEKEQCSK
ncbi:hypothetical protein FQR65_LT16682 [Abscondita terminalis]|nr:hypothetical protein FQR65_LT16682 [Abscondita terminalis]